MSLTSFIHISLAYLLIYLALFKRTRPFGRSGSRQLTIGVFTGLARSALAVASPTDRTLPLMLISITEWMVLLLLFPYFQPAAMSLGLKRDFT